MIVTFLICFKNIENISKVQLSIKFNNMFVFICFYVCSLLIQTLKLQIKIYFSLPFLKFINLLFPWLKGSFLLVNKNNVILFNSLFCLHFHIHGQKQR